MIVDVSVTNPITLQRATCSLLVDTGAQESVLPYLKLQGPLNGIVFGGIGGFLVAGNRVATMLGLNIALEIEIEQQGGSGPISSASYSGDIDLHFTQTPSPVFPGFDGLLGMDLLDGFGADAVKTASGIRGYLAERV